MKTAIIFYSKHGTTDKVSRIIGNVLNSGQIDIISLKDNKNPEINDYDKIILGTSIYVGNPAKEMKMFCENNRMLLEQKTIGLYICCMDKSKEQEQLTNAYPSYLLEIAKAKASMGGEFLFDKMNFFERFIVKKILKVSSSVSDINYKAIELFAGEMDKT